MNATKHNTRVKCALYYTDVCRAVRHTQTVICGRLQSHVIISACTSITWMWKKDNVVLFYSVDAQISGPAFEKKLCSLDPFSRCIQGKQLV